MTAYLTAIPNIGAGIGHQIANWNAGFWFSIHFEIPFCHTPFPRRSTLIEWEEFLGFGSNEILASNLLAEGFLAIDLPAFNEFNVIEIEFIKNLIKKIKKKILFFT